MEKNTIYGIAYGCPVRKRNNDCPLNKVDYLSFKEKISWIEGLNEENIKAIVEHHKHCSKSR